MQCPIEDTRESDILLDYCANKLSPESAAEFERHMRSCSSCATLSSAQRHIWNALDSWEAAPISEDFNRRLYARIERDQKQPSWQRWLSWRPAMSFGAAAAAVVVFVLMNTDAANQRVVQETSRADVDAEQVELVLEDLEMLKQLSPSNSQNL